MTETRPEAEPEPEKGMPEARPEPEDSAAETGAAHSASETAGSTVAPHPESRNLSAPPTPLVVPPSPDVALADDATPLPGAHRGGFSRLPTAPVDITLQSAPLEPGTEEPDIRWLMPTQPPSRGLAGWALMFSILGLVVSLFVGWGFPVGLVGVITATVAMRRPLESRGVAIWALVLGIVSVLYSAGWLLFAASRANLLG